MAVICLHSSQSSGSQWRPLLSLLQDPSFAQTHDIGPVLAPDLIGYGRSTARIPVSADKFRLFYEEQLLKPLLEQYSEEPLHLVGHSYGGALALRIAYFMAEEGRPLQSLSLYEPVAFHLLAQGEAAREEIAEVALRMEQLTTAEAAGTFVDYWNKPGYFDALPERVKSGMIARQEKVQADFFALLNEPGELDDYQVIQCPILLMAGQQSPQSSRRVASLLGSVWPHAQYEHINAGHMAPLTHPDLVFPAFKSFILLNSKIY